MRIAINLPEFHQIPKAGHITNHSKAESTVQPAMLHYSTTQFVNVSLCCISLTWNLFIAAFIFLDSFSAMQQKMNGQNDRKDESLTSQNDWQDESLTGEVRDQAGSAVIFSPEQNKINKRVTDFSWISMKMI